MFFQVLVCVCMAASLCTGDYLIRTRNLGNPLINTSLTIATISVPPYLIHYPNGSYGGFVPDLLELLVDNFGIPRNYTIKVNATSVGSLEDNKWTGLLGNVFFHKKQNVMAVGPILDSPPENKTFAFSTPWTSVDLSFVVKKSSGISSLIDSLNQNPDYVIVKNSAEDKILFNGTQLGASFQSRLLEATRVSSVFAGLHEVRDGENKVLVLNSLDASYYVHGSYCDSLKIVSDNFFHLGSYGIVVDRSMISYLDMLNPILDDLTVKGTIEELTKKWFKKDQEQCRISSSGAISWRLIAQFKVFSVALILLTVSIANTQWKY